MDNQADISTLTRSLLKKGKTNIRETLADKYIRGKGIEIGALHQPMPVPKRAAQVRYVDRLDVDGLKTHYPELGAFALVPVDIVDDGEKLNTFKDNSEDFIITSHFLEHTQDPIGTIKRHIEVLKPGGILFMAVPDKRYTFDVLRPNTNIEHFISDHENGPQPSYMDHVHEYVSLVDKLSGHEFDSKVEYIRSTNYSIHFHVWDADSMKAFVNTLLIQKYQLPVKICSFVENPANCECIFVLQKDQDGRPSGFWNRIRSFSI